MKIDRLMAITIYLLNNGRSSAKKLAEEFEVSPRTIVRDMDTLSQAGIPIQSSYGVDAGYEILDSYVMGNQLADSQDYSIIAAALKGLASAYASKSIKSTLSKVNALTDGDKATISIDLSAAQENSDVNERLKILEDAIKQKRIVEFQYTNNSNETKLLQVEAVGVVYKWYGWYLVGYYEKHKDYCMLKVVRMEKIHITDKHNTREHSLQKVLADKKDTQELVNIKLLGSKYIKVKCLEYLKGRVIREYENGDFEFCFTVSENETFWQGVLLSFGADVRILEPQSVIRHLVEKCNDIIKQYN